jgi:hypothetical protein
MHGPVILKVHQARRCMQHLLFIDDTKTTPSISRLLLQWRLIECCSELEIKHWYFALRYQTRIHLTARDLEHLNFIDQI